MSVFWTIALVLAILTAAYTVTIILAWGLIHGAALLDPNTSTHHRSDGPPLIDPHRKHRTHIRN